MAFGSLFRRAAAPAVVLSLALGLLAGDAATAIAPAVRAVPAPTGSEHTEVRVQNAGSLSKNATVSAQYWDAQGQVVSTQTVSRLGGGSAWSFNVQNSDIPAGYAGSVTVGSDKEIRALMIKNRADADGQSNSACNGYVRGASTLYLLGLGGVLGDGGASGWRFTVMNASTVPATVTLRYSTNSGLQIDAARERNVVIPPLGSLIRSQATKLATLGSGFNGYATVTSSTAGVELGATIERWLDRTLTCHDALTTGSVGQQVHLPLVQSNVNSWSTRVRVFNPGPGDATFKMVYERPGEVPRYSTLLALQAGWVAIIDNAAGPGGGSAAPFPAGYSGVGTVSVRSGPGLVAMVDYRSQGSPQVGSYVGLTDAEATTWTFLPTVMKSYGRRGAWNSFTYLQVPGGGAATATVYYLGAAGGSGWSSQRVINFTGSMAIDHRTETSLPAGFTGAAVVNSATPLVVTGGVSSLHPSGDTMAVYSGR